MNKRYSLPFGAPVVGDVIDFANKQDGVNYYVAYMLARTQTMFQYEGLPETISQRNLELMLQLGAFVGFYEYNGKLYVFNGGLGGELDEYYMPTIFTVANPYLNFSRNLKIGEECIIMPNDSLYIGLKPLFSRYATALVENDISLNIADISTRMMTLITCGDDATSKAAKKYLDDIVAGKIGVIADNPVIQGLKTQPYADGNSVNLITNLIEYRQYLRAGWYNDIGINANYNMKRERIVSTEAQLNDDALIPLVEDMLSCRQVALDKVNAKWGTNISVKLNSIWEVHHDEVERAEDYAQAEIEVGGDEDVESNFDNSELEN